ncbi:MAG TPA: hypothetical protein DDX14_04940 [Cyanobacteria bacterium UBA9579]|nr:hypothetical protein [Cyanobacteria bacterium UBA9579]
MEHFPKAKISAIAKSLVQKTGPGRIRTIDQGIMSPLRHKPTLIKVYVSKYTIIKIGGQGLNLFFENYNFFYLHQADF